MAAQNDPSPGTAYSAGIEGGPGALNYFDGDDFLRLVDPRLLADNGNDFVTSNDESSATDDMTNVAVSPGTLTSLYPVTTTSGYASSADTGTPGTIFSSPNTDSAIDSCDSEATSSIIAHVGNVERHSITPAPQALNLTSTHGDHFLNPHSWGSGYQPQNSSPTPFQSPPSIGVYESALGHTSSRAPVKSVAAQTMTPVGQTLGTSSYSANTADLGTNHGGPVYIDTPPNSVPVATPSSSGSGDTKLGHPSWTTAGNMNRNTGTPSPATHDHHPDYVQGSQVSTNHFPHDLPPRMSNPSDDQHQSPRHDPRQEPSPHGQNHQAPVNHYHAPVQNYNGPVHYHGPVKNYNGSVQNQRGPVHHHHGPPSAAQPSGTLNPLSPQPTETCAGEGVNGGCKDLV